ncbi:MAG TPA: MFS transporter [Acidimicrobiales bacterium]|nr:MFS transporter [Acidimicrobiales bacterium]
MPAERPRPRLLADLTPLRVSRDFRFLFAGSGVSYLGRQLTVVAVPFQVFTMTRSSLAVGMVGLATVVPLVTLSLAGGAIADAVDRRKLLLVTQILSAATSAGLALNAGSSSPRLWPIYVLAALSAGLAGVDLPARSATIPRLVGRELYPSAAALGQIQFQIGQVAGPALAGVIISQVSLAAAYWIDVASFAAAVAGIALIAPQPPEGGGTRASLASIGEGLRYLRGRRLLVSTFLIDINAMVFGMPRALFPALGTGFFGGGALTVGLLYAAPGAGALIGALLTGWVGRVRRQGRAVIVSVLVWGGAIAAFGLVPWLPLGLAMLALAGAADVISAVFRNTILQMSVPDGLRGRLSSVHIAVVTGGPQLGDAEAGAVAALASPRFSVVSGGLACIVGVLVLLRLVPELARYDAEAQTRRSDG